MRVLDELEREIERVAHTARPRRRWWRPGALLLLAPLGAATVAVAATSLSHAPVRATPTPTPDPKSGYGVITGTPALLDFRVPDLEPGAPWGMRLIKTSRGFGCVQLGRVVDGKLGTFDLGGAFHETPAEPQGAPSFCQQSDAAGHTFIATSYQGMPAGGDERNCSVQRVPNVPLCAAGTTRTLFFGLLGPEATAVTYRDVGGKTVRQPTGPEGAYIVVKPHSGTRGGFSPGSSPGSGLESVEYRDGTRCVIRNPHRLGGARPCPLKGYVEPHLPKVTAAEVKTRVRARVSKRLVRLPGVPAKYGKVRRVTIRFRARAAADARSAYSFFAESLPGRGTCPFGLGGPIARDIAAGESVKQTVDFPPSCHHRYRITVKYTQETRPGRGGMPFTPGGRGPTVGSTVIDLP